MDKVRLLFLPTVDVDNVNAQSLNVREVARRFDPAQFAITVWFEHEPDPRLKECPAIRMLKLPAKRKTTAILNEMMSGYDVIGYMDYSPASYLFLHLPRFLRRGAKAVLHAEAPTAQLVNPSRTLRTLYEGVVARCDAYTGITEFVARDLNTSWGKRPGHILPVGVDTAFFTPPQDRRNTSPVVLFVGTVIERKGPQLLVEAAASFPGVKFRIVGASREGFDGVLRQQISTLGLKNICLEGPKSQEQILQIMRESDIFVLPSRLEGIPKVTLEAAATGLPCIVFRDYETPSVVDGVTGFQVQSVKEMTQDLGKLIADDEVRKQMGAEARKHAQKFDWNLITKLWQDAYCEIAAHRAP